MISQFLDDLEEKEAGTNSIFPPEKIAFEENTKRFDKNGGRTVKNFRGYLIRMNSSTIV
ncbi:hypothetical protein WN48_00040 [Eufriesea mexicana]|nr:hypothetical protein WN48_00040 [Eufriesea mexicana]